MHRGRTILLLSIAAVLLLTTSLWLGWCWYDTHVDRSGWIAHNGITMYADFYGHPVTGWQEIGEHRYYFDANGIMQTQWVELDGVAHYFREDGTLADGWLKTGDSTYYLNENGTPLTGWFSLEDTLFYFDETGKMHTFWATLGGQRYYFLQTGAACTGWLHQEDGSYYFDKSCCAVTGWQEIEENRYYFAKDGTLYTGWLVQNESRYYLLPNGTMATGKQQIDGIPFYFSPNGIWVLLVNPDHPLSDDHVPELAETEDGFFVDALCLDSLNAMMAAMRQEGLLPLLSSAYRSKSQQAGIWQSYVNQYLAAGYDEARAKAKTALYVAVPGTSEHHTGLAVDIVGYDYFYDGHHGATKAVHAWLAEHCWEYGFILRYTEEKKAITGFSEEPWHFRYVGKAVSMDMKNSGLCLEEYLKAIP